METNILKLKQIESDFTKTVDKKIQTKLDFKSLKVILGWLIKELESKKLYSEDLWVFGDYEQINFAMNKIYTYIYDNKNCNLSQEDIKVFISFVIWKLKNLKDLVDKI